MPIFIDRKRLISYASSMTLKSSPGISVEKIEGHSFFSKNLDATSVVVDLGVNQGNFSKYLISEYGLKSFGVEAEKHLYLDYLINIEKLFVINAAITDFNGDISINRSKNYCSTLLDSRFHLSSDESVRAIDYKNFAQYFELDEVDLIKFDIEGSEIEVFSSCSDEQVKKWKQITIEFHDFIFPSIQDEVFLVRKRLKSLGFYEIKFSLDNTDVVYLNKRYFRINYLTLSLTLIFFKYFRGMRRRIRSLMGIA